MTRFTNLLKRTSCDFLVFFVCHSSPFPGNGYSSRLDEAQIPDSASSRFVSFSSLPAFCNIAITWQPVGFAKKCCSWVFLNKNLYSQKCAGYFDASLFILWWQNYFLFMKCLCDIELIGGSWCSLNTFWFWIKAHKSKDLSLTLIANVQNFSPIIKMS